MPRDHLAIRQAPWPSKDLFSWKVWDFCFSAKFTTISWTKFKEQQNI